MIPTNNYIIELIVLGASAIMLIYHGVLYFQQKDRFVILYANYLLSLTVHLIFKITTQHYSFAPASEYWQFVFDDAIILWILFSYVYFIAQVLEIENNAPLVKFAVISFYYCCVISLLIHLYKIFFTTIDYNTREYFYYSKLVLVTFAFIGIFGAFYIRKTIFVRIIIAGALVYAFFGLLTMISIYWQFPIFGFSEYKLYYIGCFLDVLLFSTALGYRSISYYIDKIHTQNKLNDQLEKNEILLKERQEILERDNTLKKGQELMNYQLQNDVIAGLSSIKIYSELMNVDDTNIKNKILLENIEKTSLQSMNDISDIIWLSNINDDINLSLILRIKNICNEYFSPLGTHFKIEAELEKATIQKEDVKDILSDLRNKLKEFDTGTKGEVTIIFRNSNDSKSMIEIVYEKAK